MTQASNEITKKSSIPTWLLIVSVLALIWYAMDLMGFVMRVFFLDQILDGMPVAQQALYKAMPIWVNVVFALEVLGGVIGSIALLVRKSWSLLAYYVCLIGTVAQTCYIIFLSDALETIGAMAVVMPLIAIGICVAMILISKTATKRAWLA